MQIREKIAEAKKHGTAEDGSLYITYYNGRLSVYLDRRLRLQTQEDTVTAFQAYNNREARFISKILDLENLSGRYSMIPGKEPYLIDYKYMDIMRPIDLLRRAKHEKTDC